MMVARLARTALGALRAARPWMHAVLSSSRLPGPFQRVLWGWYWHVWLTLKFYSYWPAANPRLTASFTRLGVAIVMGYLVARR